MKASSSLLLMGLGIWLGTGISVAAPYSTQELRSVETPEESQIRNLRDQEIQQLRLTLGRRLPANRKSDLYFRLAEIYFEGYQMAFIIEGRVHEKRLQSGAPDRYMDRSYSKPFLQKGIQACENILEHQIPVRHPDRVLYFLGFNYGELGNTKESEKYYLMLVKRYPTSPFAAEGWSELGDSFYQLKQYQKAENYFEQAAKYAEASRKPPIYHRLAWCYYRNRKFDKAIAAMKSSISSMGENNERYASLREDALKDMAVFMTERGEVEEAIRYFEEAAGDKEYYARTLERLAKEYQSGLKGDRALRVYETLLKLKKGDPASIRAVTRITELHLKKKQYAEAEKRVRAHAPYPVGGEQEMKDAVLVLKVLVRKTGTENHDIYRKKGKHDALQVAERFYQLYLELFLKEADERNETPEIRMYLADVKRELGKSAEASALYREVVRTKDPRYAREAGTLWVASLSETLAKLAKKTKETGQKSAEPSATEMEFIQATDEMIANIPDAPESKRAALKAAQILAGYPSHRSKAIDRCEKIVDRDPGSREAVVAAQLWLQLLGDAQDMDGLKDRMDSFRKNQALLAADFKFTKGELKKKIEGEEHRIQVGAISRLEKDRKYSDVAKAYEEFATTSKDRSKSETAYKNAVANYALSGDFDAAIRTSDDWRKKYPDSGPAKESLRSLATTALIRGEFAKSASLFERIGQTLKDPGALITAARIYEGNGNVSEAIAARERFLGAFRDHSLSSDNALVLALLYEKSGRDKDSAGVLKRCAAAQGRTGVECTARLADLYFRQREIKTAKQLYNRASLYRSKGDRIAQYFASYGAYRIAEIMEKEAVFAKLSLPETTLRTALAQRLQFFEPLSRAYLRAVDLGGPWAVAALDRLARWAMAFADDVDRIEPPASASEAQREQFRITLEAVSKPLRKKAIETWIQAYRNAVQFEILSPVLPTVADLLADRKYYKGARAQGFRSKYYLAGGATSGGDEAFRAIRGELEKDTKKADLWVRYGNLLWGSDKALLSAVVYDQALALQPGSLAAINNRGVSLLAGDNQEDWLRANEALAAFTEASRKDKFFATAIFNRAALLNYYRVFKNAYSDWERFLVKTQTPEGWFGKAIALQGLARPIEAEDTFKQVVGMGVSKDSAMWLYHRAARVSVNGAKGADECLDVLDDISSSEVKGFESESVERLKVTCKRWKK